MFIATRRFKNPSMQNCF